MSRQLVSAVVRLESQIQEAVLAISKAIGHQKLNRPLSIIICTSREFWVRNSWHCKIAMFDFTTRFSMSTSNRRVFCSSPCWTSTGRFRQIRFVRGLLRALVAEAHVSLRMSGRRSRHFNIDGVLLPAGGHLNHAGCTRVFICLFFSSVVVVVLLCVV